MIRAIETTDLFELMEWCQEYRHSPRCTTTDSMRRFAIGFYQIHQGIEWRDTVSGHESFAASFLHFLMVMELLNLSIEIYLIKRLEKYEDYNTSGDLLVNLSKSQQMLIYYSDTYEIKRKSRYDREILMMSLSAVMIILICKIPSECRAEALHNAMMVMTGEI